FFSDLGIVRGEFVLLPAIDLRLLQRVGVIHVDGLPLGVKIDRSDAAFAVSVAGGFGPTEGQVNFRTDRRRIDVGNPGVEITDGGECPVYIFRVDGGRQAVFDAVGDFEGVFHAIAGDDRDDRAE